MTAETLLELLGQVAAGDVLPDEALDRLSWLPVERLSNGNAAAFAQLDHHRTVRVGFPEAIYCPGKSRDQVLGICASFAGRGTGFLATRAEPEIREALRREYPAAEVNDLARTVWLPGTPRAEPSGTGKDAPVLVVSAGTADLPVAEEAAVTLKAIGRPFDRLNDVGVAGLHRLLASERDLRHASVVIAVAGMDGALPSVIGGLVGSPVIAVPTSTGYGASFGGVAALLTMLNSCASGVTVVNIDNGFGAACAAARITRRQSRV